MNALLKGPNGHAAVVDVTQGQLLIVRKEAIASWYYVCRDAMNSHIDCLRAAIDIAATCDFIPYMPVPPTDVVIIGAHKYALYEVRYELSSVAVAWNWDSDRVLVKTYYDEATQRYPLRYCLLAKLVMERLAEEQGPAKEAA